MAENNSRYFPELRPGSTICHHSHGQDMRKYRIITILGEGAVKNTYLAEQMLPLEDAGRRVALKVFKPTSDITAQTAVQNLEILQERLEKGSDDGNPPPFSEGLEMQYTAEVARMEEADKSWYIAKLYDTGFTAVGDSQHGEIRLIYLAEELVEGPNLMQYVHAVRHRKGCLRGARNKKKRQNLMTEFTDDIVRIITKVSRGLHYLHDYVMAAHGDVKAENILIGLKDDKLHALLTDFTTSRALSDSEYRQVGSMLYRAPEQIDGPMIATPQADVWSLGVLLYATLAGEYPFATSIPDWTGLTQKQRAAQERQLMDNIAKMTVVPLSDKNPRNIKPNTTLENLVTRMLNRDPAARPDMRNVYLNLQKVKRRIKEKGYNTEIPGNFLQSVLKSWPSAPPKNS